MDDDSDQFWEDINELICQENVPVITTITTTTTTTALTTTTTTAIITTTTTTTTTATASISNPVPTNNDRAPNHNLTVVRQIAEYLQRGELNSSDYAPHFLIDEGEKNEKQAGEERQEEKTQKRNASEHRLGNDNKKQ